MSEELVVLCEFVETVFDRRYIRFLLAMSQPNVPHFDLFFPCSYLFSFFPLLDSLFFTLLLRSTTYLGYL